MNEQILVALIGAIATVVASAIGVVGFVLNRSVDRVEARVEVLSTRMMDELDRLGGRLESRLDFLFETQANLRKRTVALEGRHLL